jgi:hypothetical protein
MIFVVYLAVAFQIVALATKRRVAERVALATAHSTDNPAQWISLPASSASWHQIIILCRNCTDLSRKFVLIAQAASFFRKKNTNYLIIFTVTINRFSSVRVARLGRVVVRVNEGGKSVKETRFFEYDYHY